VDHSGAVPVVAERCHGGRAIEAGRLEPGTGFEDRDLQIYNHPAGKIRLSAIRDEIINKFRSVAKNNSGSSGTKVILELKSKCDLITH